MGGHPLRTAFAAALPAFAVLAVAVLAAGCSVAPSGHGARTGRQGSGQHGAAGRTSRQPAATALPFPAVENGAPGTRHWRITHLGSSGAIEGFADRVSVLPGQSFRLYVSTTSASFRVQAFRMGWYGGAKARQVWASGRMAGRLQRPARGSPATRMVTAPWRPSMTVPTVGWPPGAYLLR